MMYKVDTGKFNFPGLSPRYIADARDNLIFISLRYPDQLETFSPSYRRGLDVMVCNSLKSL
jgi:hypothetical protein